LLYDISQLAIPVDHVDAEYVEKPRRWNVAFVRMFMVSFGPISSLFDFLTFAVMLLVFSASQSLFQTAWFLESLSTQTLVIFVIRTRRIPFYKSRPSKSLVLSAFGVVSFALVLPFTPLGSIMSFVIPPFNFWLVLGTFIASYLLLAELLKSWFYNRLTKQTLV
jgi:Mg2+-importing ATPase